MVLLDYIEKKNTRYRFILELSEKEFKILERSDYRRLPVDMIKDCLTDLIDDCS